MKKISFILLFSSLISLPAISQVSQPGAQLLGNCISYSREASQIIFHCENNAKVSLQFCSGEVIKVWVAPDGVFKRKNESFAVINEKLSELKTEVKEDPAFFEVFTEQLRIRINRTPFRLQIFDHYQRLLFSDYQNKGFVKEKNRIISYKNLGADEQFLGLGEKAGPLNRRGRNFKMWNSDQPCYGVSEDPLYKSIPFFMSSLHYGIFFDNTYKTEFKFGTESNNYYSFESPGGEMIYYFMYGKTYAAILQNYIALTGKPIMPPKWALGFSQCRGNYTEEVQAMDVAAEFRKRQIPCDIIYQDIGWTQGLQNFDWKKNNYKTPRLMVKSLSDRGFKMIVSQDPVISQENSRQWHEADSLKYFTTDTATGKSYDMPWPWGGNCGVVDFTKPAVADWWGAYQQKPLDDGVRGFWTDMGEPAWSNENAVERLRMKHDAGMHDEIHNVYGLTWDKVVAEQFAKRNTNKRIFQMTRSAYAGLQRYTFGWSGDSGNGDNVLEGWQQLANQITVGLSAGMGLIPFWACDISGYCGDIKNYEAMAELYIRWMQFGAFNPLSRAHHEGHNAVEPWMFGKEAEKLSREAIEFKYRLFPYLYHYAREAHDSGLPLMRALALEYPNDPEIYKINGEFLLGSELLVAPVVEKGAVKKDIYLPEGEWIDFHHDKKTYKGAQWISYDAPINITPLFVKKGSIIPMMPVMQWIHEQPVYPVTFDIFPAALNQVAAFELYEDDGETNDYLKEIFFKTRISAIMLKKEMSVLIAKREEKGYKPGGSRNFILKVHSLKRPVLLSINSVRSGNTDAAGFKQSINKNFTATSWYWNKEEAVVYVKIPDSGEARSIRVKY